MINKRLVLLFCVYQTFCIPLTINFHMVIKDDSGNPISLDQENVTFSLSGNTGINFWSETIVCTHPAGIVFSRLGEQAPIDPVSFYAQDSIRLTVTRQSGDTVLSQPFNSTPYAFKAGFADSALNSQLLQGLG